ncbi:unnamed protein product [Dimorphilus gyrociliatus]|uniref:SMP-LTD domain-containing protein n=1 Tax=Dimorphilus gyrociliatus TaxID=2664684 RepID=A0A7I8W2W7_9ANNE|nr:unnamed protein product [Dimorphilus gyrociliatus]
MSTSPRSTTPPESLTKLMTSVKFTGDAVETAVCEKKKTPEMEQKSFFFKDLKELKGRLSEKWHEKLPELQDRLPDSISTFITEKLDSSDKKESQMKKSVSVDTVPSERSSPGKHSRHSSADFKLSPDFELVPPASMDDADEEGEELTEDFDNTPPHLPKTSSKSYPLNLNELLEQPVNETRPKSNPSNFHPKWKPSFSKGHLFLALLVLLAAICSPICSFMSGLIIGACLSALVVPFIIYTFNPWHFNPPPLPDVKDLPPMPPSRGLADRSCKFEGWMNILSNGEYNSENFHLIDTKSAFVQLDTCILNVKIALQSLPRRACYKHNLPIPAQAQFLDESMTVDLRDCNVILLPDRLVHKRLWSKKYPICIKPSDGSKNIILFARTCLQKEQWFHRMNSASLNMPIPSKLPDIGKKGTLEKRLSTSALETLVKDQSLPSMNNPEASLESLILHLSRILPPESLCSTKPKISCEKIGRVLCEPSMIWINAIISRILWDVLKQPLWAARIMSKIQKKLAKINKPVFVDDLVIVGIDLGKAVPILRRSAVPYVDSDGLWIDIDMAYSGGVALSIETKVNLLKLRKSDSVTSSPTTDKKSPVTDSDEEDSAESSTDEEPEDVSDSEKNSNGLHTGVGARLQKSVNKKKIMQLVDRITNSRYFHAAAENRYVQRAMKEVSNTPIQLTVDIKSCVGTLVLHIPHPPTDRLWWGFKHPPHMWLTATPKIGERQVSVTHVTDWIENKLVKEFERILVLPNMDDIPLEPILMDEGFLEKI